MGLPDSDQAESEYDLEQQPVEAARNTGHATKRKDEREWRAGEQGDEADEAFGGMVASMDMPPHARAVSVGRGHRFAAYPRCSADVVKQGAAAGSWLRDALLWLLLLRVRLRSWPRNRARRRARQSAIRTVWNTLERARSLRADGLAAVFNLGLYLLLVDDDVAEFTTDLMAATNDRRRRFLAKHEAILLYEAGEDLRHLLGREFRDAVSSLRLEPSGVTKLNAAAKDLHAFWDERRAFLNRIRNAVAAHREMDAVDYLSTLETLEPLEVMKCAAEFSARAERLVSLVTEITAANAGPAGVVRDMLSSSERRRRTRG